MTKVQAVIREQQLDAVIERLVLIGIRGLTIVPVKGWGRTAGHFAVFRGGAYKVDFISKILLEWYGPDNEADGVVRAIEQRAATGTIGDGKIFIQRIDGAVRIRTGERDLLAV